EIVSQTSRTGCRKSAPISRWVAGCITGKRIDGTVVGGRYSTRPPNSAREHPVGIGRIQGHHGLIKLLRQIVGVKGHHPAVILPFVVRSKGRETQPQPSADQIDPSALILQVSVERRAP